MGFANLLESEDLRRPGLVGAASHAIDDALKRDCRERHLGRAQRPVTKPLK